MCFCCESLVTLVTVICFLLSVNSLMNLKITFLWKSCITLAALIWFFPSVISLVIYTMFYFHAKALLHWLHEYNISPVWVLWWFVSSLMNFEITFLWKSIITIASLIWFHFSVSSIITIMIAFLKMIILGNTFIKMPAFMWSIPFVCFLLPDHFNSSKYWKQWNYI